MQITESHSGSGLLVAEHAADHEAVARMLREYEPRLRLVPQRDEARRCMLWQVYEYLGPDREAFHVCSWVDTDGAPLPLSSALVEKVKSQDKRGRGEIVDVNAANQRHREKLNREQEARFDAVAADHAPYLDRGRRSVSMGPRPTRQPADHI